MNPEDAAKILGYTPEQVRALQEKGNLPDPIPDDYLDPVLDFRVRIEMAMRRKIDKQRGIDVAD